MAQIGKIRIQIWTMWAWRHSRHLAEAEEELRVTFVTRIFVYSLFCPHRSQMPAHIQTVIVQSYFGLRIMQITSKPISCKRSTAQLLGNRRIVVISGYCAGWWREKWKCLCCCVLQVPPQRREGDVSSFVALTVRNRCQSVLTHSNTHSNTHPCLNLSLSSSLSLICSCLNHIIILTLNLNLIIILVLSLSLRLLLSCGDASQWQQICSVHLKKSQELCEGDLIENVLVGSCTWDWTQVIWFASCFEGWHVALWQM